MPDIPQDTMEAVRVFLELTDDAVVAFDRTGTVMFSTPGADELFALPADELEGSDIKDFIYSNELQRASGQDLPFKTDGVTQRVMGKLADGSFIPVDVTSKQIMEGTSEAFILIAKDVQDVVQTEHECDRLSDELKTVRSRLQGTLEVIAEAMSADEPESIMARISDSISNSVKATGALVYLLEEDGYRLRGTSESLAPEWVPADAYYRSGVSGVASYVRKKRRGVRLSVADRPIFSAEERRQGVQKVKFFDIDESAEVTLPTPVGSMSLSTIVGIPVLVGDRVVAVILVVWSRIKRVRPETMRLLQTISDYLAPQLASMAAALTRRREAQLAENLGHIRILMDNEDILSEDFFSKIGGMVDAVIPHTSLLLESNSGPEGSTLYFAGSDGFSFEKDRSFTPKMPFPFYEEIDFKEGRGATRITTDSLMGAWLAKRTGLTHGAFLNFGRIGDKNLGALALRSSDLPAFDSLEMDFFDELINTIFKAYNGEIVRMQESHISQALQMGLRNELPEVSGITSATLYSSATAAAVVGGDFFDMYEIPDGRVILVIGDISGKGIEAASMSSLVKTALAAYAWNGMEPAGMVGALNSLLSNFSRLETFASLFVCSIDRVSHILKYCTAGHPPAFLYHKGNENDGASEIELISSQSGVVGAFEDMVYTDKETRYQIGDVMYLYTDGATEARAKNREFFGEEGLVQSFASAIGADLDKTLATILDDLETFTGGSLDDDIAMVAVRFES